MGLGFWSINHTAELFPFLSRSQPFTPLSVVQKLWATPNLGHNCPGEAALTAEGNSPEKGGQLGDFSSCLVGALVRSGQDTNRAGYITCFFFN